MSLSDSPIPGDSAQAALLPFIHLGGDRLQTALRHLDPNASAAIIPAADLGIPYDSVRLAGGFPTGCLVSWSCKRSVVPVDTTVNVDTTSVFVLNSLPRDFNEVRLTQLRERISLDSSYEWNFDGGNHFISLTERRSDGAPCLVVHSNEKEFKDQYNGLFPRPGNWYAGEVMSIEVDDGWPVRLVVDGVADMFTRIAKMLEEYNVVRHAFIVKVLLGGDFPLLEWHRHHYYMPNASSVAIGAYLCKAGEVVAVFSSHGAPISIFMPATGGRNHVRLDGEPHLLVPHGWGSGVETATSVTCRRDHLVLGSTKHQIGVGISLLADPNVRPRQFESNQQFFDCVSEHTPGVLVDELMQLASYSRHGFVEHR